MGKKTRSIFCAVGLTALMILSGCASTSAMNGYIEKGNVAGLEKYIAKGNSVNERDYYDGSAPLHLAAQKGNIDIVDTLVKNGADINVRTVYGRTPYMIAILYKHDHLINYFQERHIRIESNYKNSNAFYDAALTNNLEVLEYLLKNGTDMNISNTRNENALHMASGAGNLESVRLLIDNGINTSQVTANEMQPIHYAALSKKFDVVDTFLLSGIEPSTADASADSNKGTAILYEYIANRERIKSNNSNAKELFNIASNHYTNASELYYEKAEKTNDEINNKNLKNAGLFLLSIAASVASPGSSVMNSSGQIVTVTPVYYPNLQGTGNLEAIEEQYRKLSADMLVGKTNCEKSLQDL